MAYHIDEENSDIIFEVAGNKVALKVIGSSGGGSIKPIYLIKVDDATVPTDQNAFSASRSLKEIEETVSYTHLRAHET